MVCWRERWRGWKGILGTTEPEWGVKNILTVWQEKLGSQKLGKATVFGCFIFLFFMKIFLSWLLYFRLAYHISAYPISAYPHISAELFTDNLVG